MKLEFEKIKYSNIMSVGAEPIEINFSDNKRTLITGKNGGGKSTLLEALCFGLFGKPFRSFTLNRLINSVNKKKLLVELWIKYGKNSYYIKRGLKPKIFEIYKNGLEPENMLNKDASDAEMQSLFEEMLSMNITSFKQVVVLGTAGYTPFMQLSTPDRRKLVEDLLNLSTLSNMDKLNKSYLKTVNQNISTLELQLEHLGREIQTHQNFIDSQLSSQQDNINKYNEILKRHISASENYKKRLDEIKSKIADAVIDGSDQTDNINKLRDAFTKLSYQVDQTKKLLGVYTTGGDCPTCKQAIKPTPEIMQQLTESVKAGDAKLQLITSKQKEFQKITSDFMKANQNILEMKNDFKMVYAMMNTENSNAEKIKTAIEELKNKQETMVDYTAINELKENREKLTESKSTFVNEKYFRSIITEMLKDSGVKADIMSEYIPYFNKQIQHYLGILRADYNFTLDNEFNESIKSYGREEFVYESFSEGEKSRINLALLFTWRDVTSKISGVELSLLILDEVFDGSLDDDGMKDIKQILSDVGGSVIVISHKESLNRDDFDSHISMKRKGRFTIAEFS